MTDVLAPLAERYASWLALPPDETNRVETDPELVRAMPVILRIERDPVPGRTAVLEAAATAALAPFRPRLDRRCLGVTASALTRG